MKLKNILMFDVESDGLYGEGFAVGAIVVDCNGMVIDHFELLSIEGKNNVSESFVIDNILPYLTTMEKCNTNLDLRNRFHEFYMKHKDTCKVYSDCNYPVETNFLRDVVKDDEENRKWEMPYPLLDVCSVVDVNIDRNSLYEKAIGKVLRKHHPVDDCLASIYCFFKYKLESE